MKTRKQSVLNKVALIVGCALLIMSLILIIKMQGMKEELESIKQYEQELQEKISEEKVYETVQ